MIVTVEAVVGTALLAECIQPAPHQCGPGRPPYHGDVPPAGMRKTGVVVPVIDFQIGEGGLALKCFAQEGEHPNWSLRKRLGTMPAADGLTLFHNAVAACRAGFVAQ